MPPWSFPPLLPRCWAYTEGRKHPVPLGGVKHLPGQQVPHGEYGAEAGRVGRESQNGTDSTL